MLVNGCEWMQWSFFAFRSFEVAIWHKPVLLHPSANFVTVAMPTQKPEAARCCETRPDFIWFLSGRKWLNCFFIVCFFCFLLCWEHGSTSKYDNLDPLLRAYALFVSSTWFFLHFLKWCPIEWCVNLEIRPFLFMFFCPRLKVPTENARGWAVEFSFFCFIGGLKWYFASSAVERMFQPPSKTNLDPLLRAYALFVSSTWFFLHFLKWCPIESCVNLEIRPFLLMFFCPRLKVPTENARGWAVEFSFFVSLGVWNGILHHQLLRECFNLQVRPT